MNEQYVILDHKEFEAHTLPENCEVFVDGYAVVFINKEVKCESTIN